MKSLFALCFLFLVSLQVFSQAITYEYDAAGNRIKRFAGPDLTPTIILPSSNFVSNGATRNLVVGLYEVAHVSTGQNIQFSVILPTGYSVTFDPVKTSITPSGATAAVSVKNPDWSIVATAAGGRKLTFQSKPGIIITAGGNASIGFTIQRVSAQSGSTPIMTVNVVDDPTNHTYDTLNGNNIFSRIFTAL